MKSNDIISWSGTAVGTVCTIVQTQEIFQWISLGLTILSTLVAIAFTCWKWYKKASADGKITKEEVDELLDDVKPLIDKKKGEHDD